MVEKAIDLGFHALGFSGHSYLDFGCGWCMSPEGTKEYIKEINTLKKQYEDKLKIYCGTELDYFSSVNRSDYDFLIGSVHYLCFDGEYLPVDNSAEKQKYTADKYLGGSMDKYIAAYYDEMGNIAEKTGCDIIGHFDLVTKFNENDCFFSTGSKAYRDAAFSAAEKLIAYNKPFEINTGAIARGKRTTPYPSKEIAGFINEKGGCFVVTSDCHSKEKLNCAFDLVEEMYGNLNIIKFSETLK